MLFPVILTRNSQKTLAEMKRLGVIQPHLTNASREMFLELARHCPLDLVVSPEPAGMGFKVAPIAEGPRLRYFSGPTSRPMGKSLGGIQWSAVNYMLRERPDALFLNANPRYLTFWIALLWAKALGIPVYAHGHGFYRRARVGAAYRLMMTALLKLVTSYICYAPIVRQAFLENGFPARKLSVAHNSLINRLPVRPEEKTGTEPGVLFIGRLRRESRLDLLVKVVDRIRREDNSALQLHVVGDGEEGEALRAEARDCPWVVFHGGVYDAEQIRKVSLECFAGCYPGKAGLSVVHMMSLSLPVITHNNLRAHGPEPSFLRHGISGLLFDHKDPERSLYQAVRSLASDREKVAEMQRNAFADYKTLAHPSLAERLWAIIGESEHRLPAGVPAESFPAAESSPRGQGEIGHAERESSTVRSAFVRNSI
jgi:glycosyltransferase involved in cell wall biosynthesis